MNLRQGVQPCWLPRSQRRSSALQSFGGGRPPGGGGRGGGRGRGDGMDLSGLILGPGAKLSPEFQDQLQKKKLIIPGGSRPPPGAPAKLIVPESGTFPIPGGVLDASDTVTTPTPPSRYRPPAGFMNNELLPDETANLEPNDMLNRLRTRAGKWYTLAKFLPSLYKQEYDSTAVDEITGINPLEQSKWVVAGTIHESLKLSGNVPDSIMAAFDVNGDSLLHPFRFLGVEMRTAAAIYLVENKLNPTECETLARAMKEYERRTTERSGFSDHPGDCLAFKYLRDALETRSHKALVQKAELGLRVAVTDGARARLNEILSDDKPESSEPGALPTANMLLLRLNEDEIGYRSLPMLGYHDRVRVQDITNAPKASQDGAFGVFTLIGATAADVRWVALPQWKALTQARHPVALEVTDCSRVPSIVAGTKAKTDEDRKRLQGTGLLVFECGAIPAKDAKPETFYLTSASAIPHELERMELASGAALQASGRNALATLLFVCRPPARENLQVASTETSQLLQV